MKFLTTLFKNTPDEFLTSLPKSVQIGLSNYLGSDEKLLSVLRTNRAIYHAPRWVESNTFYRSWLIVTSERIITIKNSKSFTPFRDIVLKSILRALFLIDHETPTLTLELSDRSDIFEFGPQCEDILKELKATLGTAIENARPTSRTSSTKGEINFCGNCGVELNQPRHFCQNCGEKLA